MEKLIKLALLLAILSLSLFDYVLHWQNGVFRAFEAALLSVEWMLLTCIAFWCGSFIFLTFSRNDLPLIGLLLIAIATYLIGYTTSQPATDIIILFFGVTLGKAAVIVFKSSKRRTEKGTIFEIQNFLVALVLLLAFSSWWHLGTAQISYHGPRWMGLWDNPNIYGMLMGAGGMLAIGLLSGIKKDEGRIKKSIRDARNLSLRIVLFIAVFMMGTGLIFSYSRGAWVGTAVGLLYLAKTHGKLKWRFVFLGMFVVAVVVCFFWHRTSNTDAWYLKRLDLSRPSAQHRVSAWRGALQMMRDHPFGVGWNKAVGVYDKDYSPPEGGAAAITMNSYLMLGTELGLPGLFCFVAYIWLKFRSRITDSSQIGSRAGALALLVAFWFDGGLFTLATASVFWVLLELGTSDLASVSTSPGDDNSTSGNKMVPMRNQNP